MFATAEKNQARRQPSLMGTSTATTYGNFTPSTPHPGTQCERLLKELKAGRRIDPLYAWVRLGIYRLSDTVFRLRKAGWNIKTGRKFVHNRYGEPCYVANYHLVDGEG